MASKQRRLWLVAIFLLASLLAVSTARAHEARPAYLEIKETSPNQFSVLWRTPVLAGMPLPVVLTMPGDVKDLRSQSCKNWRIRFSNGDGSTPERLGWLASESSSQVFK